MEWFVCDGQNGKNEFTVKNLLWMFGILVLLAIIAVIYVAAKIFITGDKIHNPLDRSHSALRSKMSI